MNCLTYLLDLWRRGHKFQILYDSNHCVGVNKKKIFDFGDFLKKDFLSGEKINYQRLEHSHSKETVVKIFKLNELDAKTLEEYYASLL